MFAEARAPLFDIFLPPVIVLWLHKGGFQRPDVMEIEIQSKIREWCAAQRRRESGESLAASVSAPAWFLCSSAHLHGPSKHFTPALFPYTVLLLYRDSLIKARPCKQ